MKRIATLLLALLLGATVMGQQSHPNGRHHHKPPKIEEMVNDLSAIQKKRLNTVMENSRKEVDRLQAELDKVRKQIHTLTNQDGDNSSQLFPLFEREGELRAQISKEMYRTRLQIDEILTKEQLSAMRKRLADNSKKERPKEPSMAPAKAGDAPSSPSDRPHRAPRR